MDSSSHLANAVRSLNELFESKGDPKPVARIFARCHWICLQQGDVDGLQWSIRLLQGVINVFQEEDLRPDNLSAFLFDCFADTGVKDDDDGSCPATQESPRALADFHVATRHLSDNRFVSSIEAASSDLLKYHAAMGLGSLILERGGECTEALKWFQVSKSLAENLEPVYVDYKAIASYQIMKTLVQLDEIEEARTVLEVSTAGSVLSPAMLDMANAMIKLNEGQGFKDVVAAFAIARRKLVKVMVSLKDKLEEKLGSSCCSNLCLNNYTRGGRFTQWYLLLLPENEVLPDIPLKGCFVAFDLYKEARLEILKLQEGRNDAEDAKSYIEQGIELMYQPSSEVSVTAIDPLVLAHQISLRVNDLDSLWAVGTYLEEYIGRETKGDTPGMISRMVACFQKHSNNGNNKDDDGEAWTKYYIGRAASTNGKVSDEQYKLLEQSLERATTPLLRHFVEDKLSGASTEEKTALKYLERSMKSAIRSGKGELIVSAAIEQFNSLIHSHMFKEAHEVQEELRKMAKNQQLVSVHARMADAAAEYMEGYIHITWGDYSSNASRHLQRAVELLKDVETGYPGSLRTYLESSHSDGDLAYFGRSAVYVTSTNAARMCEMCSSFREATDALYNRNKKP